MKRPPVFLTIFLLILAAIMMAAYALHGYFAPALFPQTPSKNDTASPLNTNASETKSESTPADNIAPLPQNTTGIPLTLPENFALSIFAENVPGARVLLYDPAGNVLVSSTSEGKIFALPDRNSDGKADEVITVLQDLNRPHGMLVLCPEDIPDHPGSAETCGLYVAEADKVMLYEYSAGSFTAASGRKIIDLASGGRHHTVTLQYGAPGYENKLLMAAGSSCDVCYETDWRRAKILMADRNGSNLQEFASGLRNAVFMTRNPVTGEIWATEMGRDNLGDNLPPDEINIIRKGENYGWPVCYGQNVHDTQFDNNTYIQNPCQSPLQTPAHLELPAHSAPLGLAFVPEEGWPEDMWYNLLVAEHGSMNKKLAAGYKIVRYRLDAQGNPLPKSTNNSAEDFISGWLDADGTTVHGRPVDLLIQPGGTLFISDDQAGVVYRANLTVQAE